MRKIAIRNKSFNVEEGHEDFWEKFKSEIWEKTTLDIFDNYRDEDTCFLDIGSWIGPTALYAALSARKVICIEADPVAHTELQKNIALNPLINQRISVINKAISSTEDSVKMGARYAQGDSMSSILFASDENFWVLPSITPKQIISEIHSDYKKYFIKIDIEGGEYTLMPHLHHFIELKNNIFFISLHPKFVEKNPFIRFFKMGYKTQKALFPFKTYKVSLVDNHTITFAPLITLLVKLGICYIPIKSSILLHK